MLKSCLPYLGSPDCLDNKNNEPKSKELPEEEHNINNNFPSFDSTFESTSKQIFVRVVHAGGKVDHYPNAILAGKLLENLPGKWLARPEVFKQPHESIICPEEYLVPGHKYYVVPLSTIHKLKRKHSKIINKQVDRIRTEEISSDVDVSAATVVEATTTDHHLHQSDQEWMDDDDSSFCSARDFYVSKDKGSRSRSSHSGSRRARILLPLAKPKACSGYTWEPGLTSIQEVSP